MRRLKMYVFDFSFFAFFVVAVSTTPSQLSSTRLAGGRKVFGLRGLRNLGRDLGEFG